MFLSKILSEALPNIPKKAAEISHAIVEKEGGFLHSFWHIFNVYNSLLLVWFVVIFVSIIAKPIALLLGSKVAVFLLLSMLFSLNLVADGSKIENLMDTDFIEREMNSLTVTLYKSTMLYIGLLFIVLPLLIPIIRVAAMILVFLSKTYHFANDFFDSNPFFEAAATSLAVENSC
jgi:hypothetical protein